MLSVTTEPLDKCEVLMTIQVDDQQEQQLLKSAAGRISRRVQIRGFRPGKAPYHLVVRRVGEEAIRQEALEELSESVFRQALEQAGLEPFAPAQMEDVAWSPLVMKVRIPTDPVVDLGDYRALRMEPEPVEVSPEEVDQELARLQDERAEWRDVDRPARLGDRIVADLEYRAGDRVVERAEGVELELLVPPEGSNRPDLATPLVGAVAGDERTVTFTQPAGYGPPELEGQEVTLSVKVHRVQEKELFALDDDFAQLIGDYETLDDLKGRLAEELRQRKEREARTKLINQALEHIVTHAPRVEWPKYLEDRMLERHMEKLDQLLRERNLTLDAFLAAQQRTRDQLREEWRPEVQKRVRTVLVVNELIKREQLEVEPREVLDEMDARIFLAGQHADEVRRTLSTTEGVEGVFHEVLDAKLRQRVWDIVTGRLTESEPETTAAEEAQPADQPAELQPSEPA